MDNLNTHAVPSLYKAFPAGEVRRFAKKLGQELSAWEHDRNEHTACIQWQFTTNKARTKLISLYPKFDETVTK